MISEDLVHTASKLLLVLKFLAVLLTDKPFLEQWDRIGASTHMSTTSSPLTPSLHTSYIHGSDCKDLTTLLNNAALHLYWSYFLTQVKQSWCTDKFLSNYSLSLVLIDNCTNVIPCTEMATTLAQSTTLTQSWKHSNNKAMFIGTNCLQTKKHNFQQHLFLWHAMCVSCAETYTLYCKWWSCVCEYPV